MSEYVEIKLDSLEDIINDLIVNTEDKTDDNKIL
jgi:hypothetical protein